MSIERVRRYDFALTQVVALVTAGVLAAEPALIAAAAVPFAFVAYGALSTTPATDDLVIEREVNPRSPVPGERVTVSLSVRNDGDGTLTDVRVVDGVPDTLTVVEGSPRACLTLTPGEATTLTYELAGKRGEWSFDDPVVRRRSLSATRLSTGRLDASGARSFACQYELDATPIQEETTRYSGPLATDAGGDGTEFYATREYRNGDPASRIDWRQLAKTGDLATVEYRAQQATNVVVAVDARDPTRVAARRGFPTGAALSGYAGERAFDALSDAGHPVGVAVLGVDTADLGDGFAGSLPWVAPGLDADTVARASVVFETVADLDSEPSESEAAPAGARSATAPDAAVADGGDGAVGRLRDRLPSGAQVLLVTPALDGAVTDLVRGLRNADHPVTVVSPDATGDGSLGGRIARMERHYRLRRAAEDGAAVVDWTPTEPLDVALATALADLVDT